ALALQRADEVDRHPRAVGGGDRDVDADARDRARRPHARHARATLAVELNDALHVGLGARQRLHPGLLREVVPEARREQDLLRLVPRAVLEGDDEALARLLEPARLALHELRARALELLEASLDEVRPRDALRE